MARLVQLVAVMLMAVPVAGQGRSWSLRRDFRSDVQPAPWRYRKRTTTAEGTPRFVDLIPTPEDLQPCSWPGSDSGTWLPPRGAWIDPEGINSRNEYRAWVLVVDPSDAFPDASCDATFSDESLFIHPNRSGVSLACPATGVDTIADSVVISWTAPFGGRVRVEGLVGHRHMCPERCLGEDGIRWIIGRGLDPQVAPELDVLMTWGQSRDVRLFFEVDAGDVVSFRCDHGPDPNLGNEGCDHGELAVNITYMDRQLPGDCNQDGLLDISDAVCVFRNLFAVPEGFPCGDGSSADPANRMLLDWHQDGGAINLTDGMAILNYLFRNGPPHALAAGGAEGSCLAIPGCPQSEAVACGPVVEQTTVTVSARSDIFASGWNVLEASDGCNGIFPVEVLLPAGELRTVIFPSVVGAVNCCRGELPDNGPDGATHLAPTSINSFRGISGIFHGSRTLFLTGVFLDDREPSGQPPPTLDFTASMTASSFDPLLRQLFFIGDGRRGTGAGTLQGFRAPAGATRLFLGFADAGSFEGDHGAYCDNRGELTAVVEVSVDDG